MMPKPASGDRRSPLSFASLPVKHKPLRIRDFWPRWISAYLGSLWWSKFTPTTITINAVAGRCLWNSCCVFIFFSSGTSLSDRAVEERIYDRNAFQRFLKLDIFNDVVPDETTVFNFRHLLEKHGLTEKIFRSVNTLLQQKGFLLKEGSIVDATIIHAPSSTKNQEKKRDPDMSSTKKNGQWHFGMKMHLGVDAQSGLIHSLEATTAKWPDCSSFAELLHGEEQAVFGDKGYASHRDKHFARQSGVFLGVLDKATRGLSGKQKKQETLHYP